MAFSPERRQAKSPAALRFAADSGRSRSNLRKLQTEHLGQRPLDHGHLVCTQRTKALDKLDRLDGCRLLHIKGTS